MTTPNLHVIGVDPGGTTGWARFTVPRESIFGDAPSQFVEWSYGELHGPEEQQAIEIARLARTTQSLDYLTGPAIVIEAWDIDPDFRSTDPETLSPARIGAMLMFARTAKWRGVTLLGDSTVTFQPRALAKTTMTDDRL